MKKRVRVRGRFGGLCLTYLAKLLGRSYIYTKQLVYQRYGTAQSNKLTPEQIGLLIWQERTKQRIKQVKNEISEKY